MKIITMLTAWVELRVKCIPLRLNEFEDAYEKAPIVPWNAPEKGISLCLRIYFQLPRKLRKKSDINSPKPEPLSTVCSFFFYYLLRKTEYAFLRIIYRTVL